MERILNYKQKLLTLLKNYYEQRNNKKNNRTGRGCGI